MHDRIAERRFLGAVILLAFGLSACGGGSGPVPVAIAITPAPIATATPSSPAGTYVRFSITFPAEARASSVAGTRKRKPDYISPSIASLAIVIDGGTPSYIEAPVATGSPQTVTTTIAVSPGTHSFTLAEYDQAMGAGNLLGRVTMSATVLMGQLNTLPFTLDGELAKIVIQPPATPFVEGALAGGLTLVGCQPETFNAVPEDADGNVIIMPGLIPQITVSSAAPASIASSPVSTNQFTLEGPAPVTPVAITASGTDLNGNAVSTTFDVGATAAFYVADFTVQKVRVFDENGTPLTLPPSAFANLSNPMGLAASPCSATASGNVYVTETSNSVYPFVQEYDMSGNAQTLASGAFTFDSGNYIVSQPIFLTYGPGYLIVPDEYGSTVTEFTPAGVSIPFPALTNLSGPIGAAYDPHDQQIYVTNGTDSNMTVYSAAGTYIGTVTTNSHPNGVVFDSNNDSLYVAAGGTTGSVLDTATPSPANVAEYSEAPAAVTNVGGFLATSTTAYYTGIAFDPYSKELYVSDAGDSEIVAYTEAGAAVTLASGAFSTINATTTPKADPMDILFVP